MRMSYVLCFLMAVFSTPVVAADADPKQEVQKISAAYVDSFNRHDGAGIAALYATGGMLVNPAGPHTDISEFYQGLFKAGIDHEDGTVDQVWPLGTDTVLAVGEYHVTGKKPSGEPIEGGGRWTGVYVREAGNLKIGMISAFPKAPPPKD